METLRDGSTSLDPRCSLLFAPPEKEFINLFGRPPKDEGIFLSKREPINKIRIKKKGVFNQQEGSCVGMSGTDCLEREPGIVHLGRAWAVRSYFYTQRHDQWPGGEYPGANPVKGGTSIEDWLNCMKNLGIVKSFCRAYTLPEILVGIGYYSSCIMGIMWTANMAYPDKYGVSVPTGRKIGGHATDGFQINLERGLLGFANSWGQWNKKTGKQMLQYDTGHGCIRFRDLEKLLKEEAEFWFVEDGDLRLPIPEIVGCNITVK